jgi:hypothetical protein
MAGELASVIASFELALASAVLAAGAGGVWHALMLAGWVAAAGCVGGQYARRRARWTSRRRYFAPRQSPSWPVWRWLPLLRPAGR